MSIGETVDAMVRQALKDAEREAIIAWHAGERPPTPVHDAEAIAALGRTPT